MASMRTQATLPRRRVAEVHLFDTCTMKCGYCWLAETGLVADTSQLAPFRDPGFIDKIARFFNSRTSPSENWMLQMTGGEPLLMPNLARFAEQLFECGNKLAPYTSLFVDREQAGFRFILRSNPSNIDYVMASFHPEAEQQGAKWFDKLRLLKDAGHNVFLRFVGHPSRLSRLEELSQKCREWDICFYPTTLFTNTYPSRYTKEEREHLSAYFTSLSQFIQLNGGVDTRTIQCFGGSRLIAVNLQTGNITPCISVGTPSLGNVFEDRLQLFDDAIACPGTDMSCACDVHYQNDVLIGISDSGRFSELKGGYAAPLRFDSELQQLRSSGVAFYAGGNSVMGDVHDDLRLIYSIDEVKNRLKRADTPPRTRAFQIESEILPPFRMDDFKPCGSAKLSGKSTLRIETGPEQWAYAAIAPLANFDESPGRMVARLQVIVESGEVGIGFVGEDFSTYVGEGERVRPKGEWTLDLNVEASDQARWIVVRNCAPDSSRSKLNLLRVEAFRAT